MIGSDGAAESEIDGHRVARPEDERHWDKDQNPEHHGGYRYRVGRGLGDGDDEKHAHQADDREDDAKYDESRAAEPAVNEAVVEFEPPYQGGSELKDAGENP